MKKAAVIPLMLACLAAAPALHAQDIKKGDKVQTLSNLHPDMAKRLLYSTNYQQAGLIPVCTDVTVTKINKSEMVFDYQGVTYTFAYDKHTKGAGVSFQDVVKTYFGPACEKSKIDALSAPDKEGIRSGQPKIGMTKAGIVFAMGRPPFHANPNLDANYWLYWKNKFGKTGLEFDDKGKLTGIR